MAATKEPGAGRRKAGAKAQNTETGSAAPKAARGTRPGGGAARAASAGTAAKASATKVGKGAGSAAASTPSRRTSRGEAGTAAKASSRQRAAAVLGLNQDAPPATLPGSAGPVERAEFQRLTRRVATLELQVRNLLRRFPDPPRGNDGSGDGSGSSSSDGSI